MEQPEAPATQPATPAPSAWALTYAREQGRVLQPAPPGKVRVELLTDPWSVWCWGWEPVRRTLELRYPQVEFRTLVGGMFPKLPDPKEVGLDIQRFFANVQRTTGMPLRLDATSRDRPESTYPACIAAHAARLLAPEREAAFLRAMRETAYLDARNISRYEVAADAAERAGLDRAEFTEALASGEPEREFRERLALLHGLNLHAYPTLLVTAGERTARVEGFQALPAVLSIAESLSGRILTAMPPPEPAAIVRPGERVATRELAEVMGTSVEAAYDALRGAEASGALVRDRHPSGDTWRRP